MVESTPAEVAVSAALADCASPDASVLDSELANVADWVCASPVVAVKSSNLVVVVDEP
jgi:hypothetical protein